MKRKILIVVFSLLAIVALLLLSGPLFVHLGVRPFISNRTVKVSRWFGAMLTLNPFLRLWLISSENPGAMESLRKYEAEIPSSKATVRVLEGMDHEKEFKNIE